MSGVVIAGLSVFGELLRAAITIGNDGGDNYGVAAGSYGSIDDDDYVDRGGNTRTILTVAYDVSAQQLFLILEAPGGVHAPNSAATFAALQLGATVFLRASAAYSTPGNTLWTWSSVAANPIGTSGAQALVLR